jgi:hypothetical protein
MSAAAAVAAQRNPRVVVHGMIPFPWLEARGSAGSNMGLLQSIAAPHDLAAPPQALACHSRYEDALMREEETMRQYKKASCSGHHVPGYHTITT